MADSFCFAHSPVSATDIVVPSQDQGPPQATTDTSGYFPYLWCGVGVSTYVFIDPIGNYGYNKGTNNPIFANGLDGGINVTKNAIKAQGDGATVVKPQWLVPVGDIAGNSGIQYVECFAQSANKNQLTWGVLGSAMAIMKDFVQTYPLYADTMYFQISDSHYGTTGNGYMGVRFNGSTDCWLKGSTAQENGVPCAMPTDYPDN